LGRKASGTPAIRWLFAALVTEGLILAVTASGYAHEARRLDELPIFYRLFLQDWPLAAVASVLLVIAPVSARFGGQTVDRVIRVLDSRPRTVAMGFIVISAVLARLVYLAHPLSMDEYGAIFQAKVFGAGHLTGRMPPVLLTRILGPGFLGFFYSANPVTGQIVSNYWPGFSLLLTPFMMAGLPWLLNPLIGGLTVLALHRLALRLYPGTDAPGWAVLFAIASPMFLVNCISFYSMPAHLLANTVYVLLLLDPSPKRLFAAGLTGGFALSLHQPFPHAVFAAPWLIWIVLRPGGWRRLGYLAAGYLPLLVVLFGGWAVVSSAVHANGPVEGAYQAMRADGTMAHRAIELLRFIFKIPTGEVIAARFIEIAKLMVWTVPALPFLALTGTRGATGRPAIRLLVASAGLTLLAYFAVGFNQGHGWGDRYFYPAFMVIAVIAAGRVAGVSARHNEVHPPGVVQGRDAGARVAGFLSLSSLVVLNATALFITGRFIRHQLAQRPVPDPAHHEVIVLDVTHGYYTNDLVQNDPFLRGPVIWIAGWGDGTDSAWVASRFPGAAIVSRPEGATVWRLDR
jgi:hypothetical protein